MNTFRQMGRLILALLFCCMMAGSALAQTNQGQIAGNVLDPTGAAIANAEISARSESTGSVYKATSTSSGSYRFPSIELGRYTITTTAPGFKQEVDNGVEVRVGSTTGFDVKLVTGGTTETVSVDANAPTVETESSDVGGTVSDKQIIELPLSLSAGVGNLRSAESFVFLIPGTAGPGTANNSNGVFISKIGGGQNFGNEVLLDGASQTRSENGSSFDEEAPSVEAISEFKVTTSTPAAEFGRTTGGIENFVTKSGTNHFHGSAFGIFKNEYFDANNWFNNGRKAFFNAQAAVDTGTQKASDIANANKNRRPPDKQFDFGISVGGPVTIPHLYNGKDRTFAFFSWEQFRFTTGGNAISTVPTVAERGGDFSDQLNNGPSGQTNPCDGTQILNGQIFDPTTTRTVTVNVNGVATPVRCRTAFPGNVIPTARLSTVGKNIAAFYPAPTTGGLVNNYSLFSSSPLTDTTYTIRVDHSIGSKDKLFGSYSSRENQRLNPNNLTLPAPVDPNVQTQDFITHFGRAGWDHIFSPNVLNHLNLGFNRSNSINGSIEAQSGVNYNTQLGTPFTAGFPRVDIGGYQSLSRNQLGDNIDNGIRVNDAVSLQRGRNSFKFGVDWRYQQYSSINLTQVNGFLSFQGSQTKATQTLAFQNGTGNGFASLLLGAGDNSQSTVPAHQPRWISNYYAGFAQDDFKVSNSLVLNLGLRYDVDQPRREAQNNTSNFSPTAIDPKNGRPGAVVFGTTAPAGTNTRWANTYFKDVAPRVGFAFSPASLNNTFVLRGGFAVLYGALQYADFGGAEIAGYSVQTFQNSNGFDPAFQVDGGVSTPNAGTNLDPAYFDNGNANAPQFVNSNYIEPGQGRPPQIDQWNLQIQQQLAKDLILTVGYIGSSGQHLRSGTQNINNIAMSNFSRGDNLVSYDLAGNGVASPYTGFNGNVQQALRPFPQYGFIATDCCLQNTGHSTYEALIASLERRTRQGLTLNASYTWSKDITNADSSLPGTNGGISQEQNPFDSKSQKSISIQDIPNTFVLSYLYELPFGLNKRFLNFRNPVSRALISGFEVGAVQRYQSGEPISFGLRPNGQTAGASGIPGWDNFIEFTRIQGASLASNARKGHLDPLNQFRLTNTPATKGLPAVPNPNVDSEFNGIAVPTNNKGISDNPAYAALQTSPVFLDQNTFDVRRLRNTTGNGGDFQFGDVPRITSEIRNYRYINEDFSILKKTPLGEGKTLFLKLDIPNAFNRHIFSTPNTAPGDPDFGIPGGTLENPRQLQLTGRIQF